MNYTACPQTPTRKRRLITCASCDKPNTGDLGHKLCSRCHTWWRRHGKPLPCPSPAERHNPNRPRHAFTLEEAQRGSQQGHEVQSAARLGRIEDYRWLREQGHTPTQAAQRLGIRAETARQYETAS